EGGRRVAFLGDMLELGPVSELEHIAVGQKCAALGIDTVVCVGERARDIGFGGARHRSKTEFFFVADSGAAAERAAEFVRRGDAVLVKGSHAMHMEKISERLKNGA
ncbi:MAG: UDP-N-acetylmuramoyl-tripeptide--D-alanyl-D-alanine ligase, partial [Clostridia bacterium]|nr:UDP-N-acetylmuramoyl-tripeptide--D-alanyl-D-alanine ligase [Clostridia bacterium]